MRELSHNVSLKNYNTFGMDVYANAYADIENEADIANFLPTRHAVRVLGGGSNILLKDNVPGVVLRNCLKGIEVFDEDENFVRLKVASGEVWHTLVMFAVQNGWGGLENLALIPGTVGAAPIQNIGAYGAEAKDTIEAVHYLELETGQPVILPVKDCGFGYRDSIFKHALAGKVFITAVVFRLSKHPIINTAYGAIEQELQKMGVVRPFLADVAQAVISIRTAKLPDPKVTGNAGSFFKNPTIPRAQYDELVSNYPTIPAYPVNEGWVKIPAGWLIETAGWKGYRKGDAGVHPLQALVLCNYGAATGNDIWDLSDKILRSVKQLFGILLEREVQVWE